MAQMRVFVSHSSSDKAVCDAFVAALRRTGADVWYDEHNLGAGQLMDEIQRELHARPVFVVLLSPDALASRWVQRECKWAYTLADQDPSRIILPIVVATIDPKELLAAMLFLSDFKRVEGPRHTPYPQSEAIERTLRLLQLTPAGHHPASIAQPQPAESLDDLLTKGRALMAQNKHAEAIPFFERATALNPRSFDGWANLAAEYLRDRRWQDGLIACDRALDLNQKNAETWNNKAAALQGLRRYDEALIAYDRALAIDADAVGIMVGQGAAFGNLGRHKDELDAYDRALVLDPTYADAWANRAIALRSLGRTKEAEEAERKAKALGGGST